MKSEKTSISASAAQFVDSVLRLAPRIAAFDCDGTLANTMPLHWRAWQVITTKYKLHFPEDRF